jgi:uncharacterized membrane protein
MRTSVAITGLLAAEVCVLIGPHPVRVAAGLPLVLVLPGLAITRGPLAALGLQRTERWLLVPGLSIATTILVGFLISAANLRLTTDSWALSLGMLTLSALAAAAPGRGVATALHRERPSVGLIRERLSNRPAFVREQGTRFGRIAQRHTTAAVLLLLLGSLATVEAVLIAVEGQRAAPTPGFTDLWAVRARTASASSVRLGVQSHERRATSYRVQVSIGGRVDSVETIEVRPGQTWLRTQAVPTTHVAVSVTLTKDGGNTVYRHVRLAPS